MAHRGHRGARGGRGGNSNHGLSRGGIQKQRGGPRRVDKDGDLVDMGVGTGFTRGGGRGGRDGRGGRGARGGRGDRGDRNSTNQHSNGRGFRNVKVNSSNGGLNEITVLHLKESEVSANEQGGIKDLKNFLEKKANQKKGQNEQDVRIIKYRWDGDGVILSVKPKDTSWIEGLDGIQFAKAKLSIEITARNVEGKKEMTTTRSTAALEERAAIMIQRRFNAGLKQLDLSSLAADPDLGKEFTQNQASLFAQLMQICDNNLSTPELKRDTIQTVSLANNNLADLDAVTTLSRTFPDLLNLDLSNNNLKAMPRLEAWRWDFRSLDHLILSGNPIVTEIPNYQNEVLKWFPKLRFLNLHQIRSDEQAAAAKGTTIPLSVLGPSHGDPFSLGTNFVSAFFPSYDSSRVALAGMFFDADSIFSVSINPHGHRAPGHTDATKQEWEAYSKTSHNMTKLTTLPGRIDKVNKGTQQVRDCWSLLPNTQHPSVEAQPEKWHMEFRSVPWNLDPSGQSPSALDALLVTVYGEFLEVDVTSENVAAQRSFDRTFVLAPGKGVGGIRVVSDVLVIGPYGGFEAWKYSGAPISQTQTSELPQFRHAHTKTEELHIPEGFGEELEGKPNQQVLKEKMAIDLSKMTRMTIMRSGKLLENTGWDLKLAKNYFDEYKTVLPPDAFLPES